MERVTELLLTLGSLAELTYARKVGGGNRVQRGELGKGYTEGKNPIVNMPKRSRLPVPRE